MDAQGLSYLPSTPLPPNFQQYSLTLFHPTQGFSPAKPFILSSGVHPLPDSLPLNPLPQCLTAEGPESVW